MQAKSKNLIYINIASLIMSFSGLFAKWISVESYSIIFGRSVAALPVLLLICIIFKVIKPIQSKRHLILIIFSGIFLTLHWTLFYKSVQVSSVSVGIIAIFSYPLITSILEPLLTQSVFKIRMVLESVILLVSLYILSGHTINGESVYIGLMLGIIAAFSFALRNIIIKEIVDEYSPIWLMMIQIGISIILLAPFGIAPLMDAGAKNIGLIIIVGIMVISLSHTLFIQSMKTLSATAIGVISSLQLIYAIVASWLFLNETISINIALGAFLISSVAVYEQIKSYNEK
ncbi:MAG: hypothetical protein CL503_02195 [Actinobacteria bacterium]|nr:hypothetical protein [Actinomycetota bacterium]|tara:strand:+ start:186 stop:1046 length:861 start_codon:yes stop_codon:yes gene_type:complete